MRIDWARHKRRRRIRRAAWTFGVLVAMVLGVAVFKDWRSLERGNRLFRGGRARAAAEVYASRLDDTTTLGLLVSYNLGTALLGTGSEEAERHLLRATEGLEPEAVWRAHYNLAYRLIEGLDVDSDPFSAVPLLVSSMEHSRAALRIGPQDENALWNLALAARIYDEMALVFEEGPVEDARDDAEGPVQRSEESADPGGAGDEAADTAPEANPGELQGPEVGSPETLARGDPGTLSEDTVRRMLEGRTDDTVLLVQGILWSQRPEISGLAEGGFPGGVR